jgi:hypothetical protein
LFDTAFLITGASLSSHCMVLINDRLQATVNHARPLTHRQESRAESARSTARTDPGSARKGNGRDDGEIERGSSPPIQIIPNFPSISNIRSLETAF